MAKFVNDTVMDTALNYVKNNSTKLVLCAGQPTSFSEAQTNAPTGKRLGEIVIDSTDFTLANGDTSGRKVTSAQQVNIDIDVSGTADHVALVDTGNSALLVVTTLSNAQAVTAGNTATVNAFDYEITDAT